MRYFQSTLTNSFSCFSQYSRVLLYKTIPIQFLIFFFFTFLREKLYFMVFSRLIVASKPYVLSLLLVLSFAPTESFFSRYSGFPLSIKTNNQEQPTNSNSNSNSNSMAHLHISTHSLRTPECSLGKQIHYNK